MEHRQGQVEIDAMFVGRRDGRPVLCVEDALMLPTEPLPLGEEPQRQEPETGLPRDETPLNREPPMLHSLQGGPCPVKPGDRREMSPVY